MPGAKTTMAGPSGPKSRSLNDPENLRDLVQKLKEGIYISNRQGEVLDANPAFLEMLGISSLEELRRHRLTEFLDPEVRKWELNVLARDGFIREFELQIRRKDGKTRTALDSAYAVENPETGEMLYKGILVDITERKRLENQLREQSIRDPLTGCFNRRYLQLFEHGLEPAARWGCIMIDVDRFKQYNDQHGHAAGDEVLVRMSRFLMRQMRAEEAVVRMGGDEFLVLLRNSDAHRTDSVAKRLQASEAPVPFSLGWAARENQEKLEKTISRADKKLYAVRGHKRTPEHERRKR
jgi:diguanylate cyclase (GGDEF)-like protein/PAS domain S-box-containing protein